MGGERGALGSVRECRVSSSIINHPDINLEIETNINTLHVHSVPIHVPVHVHCTCGLKIEMRYSSETQYVRTCTYLFHQLIQNSVRGG